MNDWKKIISSVAPTLATALGGPLAGTATKYLTSALLDDKDQDLEDVILSASPEKLAQIKEIEAKFKTDMKKLDIDIESLAVNDRKSARQLAAKNMAPQITLSFLFIFGYFFIIWVLFSGAVTMPEQIGHMLSAMLGVLTSGIPMILRFWFGGSLHDKDHMDKIYRSTPKS
tara:strand:- start:383 stop:895 length:513 start_codon:yes stop_codon:yes gene_type:complete